MEKLVGLNYEMRDASQVHLEVMRLEEKAILKGSLKESMRAVMAKEALRSRSSSLSSLPGGPRSPSAAHQHRSVASGGGGAGQGGLELDLSEF